MQQPMNTNQVQVVVLAQPSGTIDKQSIYRNMKSGSAYQLIGSGILQLLIGILCIIFQSISIGVYASGYSGIDYIGHGYWTGIMFIITGTFGIAGGLQRKRCQVVTFNVLSILSVLFAAILLCISIPGAIIYAIGEYYCDTYYYVPTTPDYYQYFYTTPVFYNNYFYTTPDFYNYYNTPPGYYNCYDNIRETSETGTAMEATMAVLAVIEGIIAVWAAVTCCTIGACCCDCGGPNSSSIQNQLLMTSQPSSGQQQIFITNQQQSPSNQQPQMFIPNQAFLPNWQHPVSNLDPRHVNQYYLQHPNPPPYSYQSNANATFPSAPGYQGSYTGIHAGLGNNLAYPE